VLSNGVCWTTFWLGVLVSTSKARWPEIKGIKNKFRDWKARFVNIQEYLRQCDGNSENNGRCFAIKAFFTALSKYVLNITCENFMQCRRDAKQNALCSPICCVLRYPSITPKRILIIYSLFIFFLPSSSSHILTMLQYKLLTEKIMTVIFCGIRKPVCRNHNFTNFLC
jgi:hypothetical protein